jgi:hypothetical protein
MTLTLKVHCIALVTAKAVTYPRKLSIYKSFFETYIGMGGANSSLTIIALYIYGLESIKRSLT